MTSFLTIASGWISIWRKMRAGNTLTNILPPCLGMLREGAMRYGNCIAVLACAAIVLAAPIALAQLKTTN